MKRRPLSWDVDVKEMLYMKNELNMSHAEIANQLGINKGTVYKYIGRQCEKRIKTDEEPTTTPDVIEPDDSIPEVFIEEELALDAQKEEDSMYNDNTPVNANRPVLKVVKESYTKYLEGTNCVFKVDTASDILEMEEDGMISGIIGYADIPKFIEELKLVHQMWQKANADYVGVNN